MKKNKVKVARKKDRSEKIPAGGWVPRFAGTISYRKYVGGQKIKRGESLCILLGALYVLGRLRPAK
jgi:hypothetical protein